MILAITLFLTGPSRENQEKILKNDNKTHDKLDTIDGKLSQVIKNKKHTSFTENLNSKIPSSLQSINSKPISGVTKLVSKLEKFLMHEEAKIQSPDYIDDQVTGKSRKVDISIRKKLGSFPILIIIECQNESSLDDILWIEQIAQKKEALRASKAVAVFSNNLSDSALRKASSLNIETRLLNEITLNDISNWCKVQYLNQWVYHADFLKISIRSEQAKQDQLNQFIRNKFSNLKVNTDSELFLNVEDGKKCSFIHVWRSILSKKREEIYSNVKQSNKKIRRTLFSTFSNPESRYQILTDDGPVDILDIEIICDLWIEEKQIPATVLNKFRSRGDQLFDTVGWELEANGKKFNLNLHRDLKTGQMYISGNDLSEIDFTFKEIIKGTLSEEN